MPRKGKRRTIARGIYSDARGLEAHVNVTVDGTPLQRTKRYERETKIATIREWQRETEAELRKLTGVIAADAFAAEIEIYLPLVRHELASFADRERHLRAWVPLLGRLKRHQIKTAAIDKQLRVWRNVDQLSASTVNQRRDALADFFAKMNGTDASNPVKGAVWFRRPKSTPKGIDRGRIARVLAHMDPDRRTRWRLALIHWTGMRPSQQGRLQSADDFYIDDRAFLVEVNGQRRRVAAVLVPSGKGGDPVMFPLLGEGEAVARAFLRVDAFWHPPTPEHLIARRTALERRASTPTRRRQIARIADVLAGRRRPPQTWSCPSAYKRIVAAAQAIGEAPFTVYAIKHSFATALRRTGTDLSDIQDMLGHADIRSTRIYAPAVQAKHVQALDRLHAEDARQYDQRAAETGIVALNRGSVQDVTRGVA